MSWSAALHVVQMNRSLLTCSTLAMKLRVLLYSLTNFFQSNTDTKRGVGMERNMELVTKVHSFKEMFMMKC